MATRWGLRRVGISDHVFSAVTKDVIQKTPLPILQSVVATIYITSQETMTNSPAKIRIKYQTKIKKSQMVKNVFLRVSNG